jgi:hypothetical protein
VKRLLLLVVLIIVACGQGMTITMHYEVPQEELWEMAGYVGAVGYAKWTDTHCDVYIGERARFITQACYDCKP